MTVEIPPAEGYGDPNSELVFQVRREQLPSDIEVQEGMMLEVRTEEGGAAYVRITDFNDESVTLDGNHPLAGKTLVFDIAVVEVA